MLDNETPKFGDIVLVAKGRLERANNDSYVFVQSERSCDRRCYERSQNSDNVTAMWTVERIRHRDPIRGHRFELRFTVVPLNEDKSYGADTGLRISKSFIVRDDDYPRYFVNENFGHAVTRRSDILTTGRRTLASVMEMFDIMPLINAISPFTPRYQGPNYAELPQRNLLRNPTPTMTVMRLPVPKAVRFPESQPPPRTPFSGNPMSGVHIFLNNPPTQNAINPAGVVKKPQFQYYGKPMFHLDKATDYNHAMEYQGAINAKKLYPGNQQKEVPKSSPAPVHENTLDWKPSSPIVSHFRQPTGSGTSSSTRQNDIQADGSSSSSATTNTNTLVNTNPPSSAYQLTTVYGKDQNINQPSNLLFDPVQHQIPSTQLQHPFLFPHFSAPPAFVFPIQNHISHTPFGPLSMQIVTPSGNGAPHNQVNIPQQNHQQQQQNDGLSTTTHYGQVNGLGPVPPFMPLHPSMARVRPLSRYPVSPPRKELNVQVFRESQKHEKNKFSDPDPWYTTVTPSTAPLKSVLQSPYSHSTRPVTTVIPEDQSYHTVTPTVPFEPTKISDKISSSAKPDSINAQLPAPAKGMNTRIPYVSEPKPTKAGRSKIYSTPASSSDTTSFEIPRPSLRTKPFKPSTLLSITSTGPSALDYSTTKYKNGYKTTEKPVLKWIPKKARTKATEPTDSAPVTSTVRSYDRYTTTTRSPRPETTTTRPRSIPNITTSRPTVTSTSAPTSTEVRSSVSSNTRYRGRSRYNRRKDNITHNGVLDGASSETKPRISSIEVLNGRRKIKRTRLSLSRSTTSRTTITTSTTEAPPMLHYFTTSTAFPFLPTTTIEPPSTTAEIVRAAIHPIETNSTNVHLFRATDISAPDSNELDSSLTDAIIKHAKELHSPGNAFYYNKKQKLYRAYGDSTANTNNNSNSGNTNSNDQNN